MAERVHDLRCTWRSLRRRRRARVARRADPRELRANIAALPGFGEMKVKALGSVLAKRFGVATARELVPPFPTLGDVDSRRRLRTTRRPRGSIRRSGAASAERRRAGRVSTAVRPRNLRRMGDCVAGMRPRLAATLTIVAGALGAVAPLAAAATFKRVPAVLGGKIATLTAESPISAGQGWLIWSVPESGGWKLHAYHAGRVSVLRSRDASRSMRPWAATPPAATRWRRSRAAPGRRG